MIIAQVLAISQNCQDMEMPKWVEEVLSRIKEPEAQMVTGERAFQAASLLFMENWCWVVQNSWKLDNLMESMGELRELRQAVRRQGEMILSLTDCITRLERRDRRGRRSLGDSSS